MSRIKLLLRYLLLLTGLFLMGLGISLTTKSNLGTSPISSVPYVLSMIFPLTFGTITFLMSLLFILLQIVLLGKDFARLQLLQIVVAALFGAFIDLGMFVCAWINPQAYVCRLAVLLIGSIVLAMGIYLQVVANVIINPGEGTVRTIARKTGLRFGTVKVLLDATLLTISTSISLAVFGAIRGTREGSIASALLVGSIANVIHSTLSRCRPTRQVLDYFVQP